MASIFDDIARNLKASAEIAVDAAEQVIEDVKLSFRRTVDVSTLNTSIRTIKQKINREFAQIGELVYKTSKNPETAADGIDERLARLDALYAELNEAVAERDRRNSQ
ncbi:MAG: hypothetical protein FWG36_07500 [Oscillospiraceae bacterium]|nr:hypothetical protein [Oscillospiraceae bacterium]